MSEMQMRDLHNMKVQERIQYWTMYYAKNPLPCGPSSFATFVFDYLQEKLGVSALTDLSMVELGCGNGRDSIFFADKQIYVTGVDQISEEISVLSDNYAGISNLKFSVGDFSRLPDCPNGIDIVYSRFTWHAITVEEEERCLNWIAGSLRDGGFLFIEARSIKDELFCAGTKIGETESITDHYRRFVDVNTLLPKLEAHGLHIEYLVEQKGLAIHGAEDPVVVRIIARQNLRVEK